MAANGEEAIPLREQREWMTKLSSSENGCWNIRSAAAWSQDWRTRLQGYGYGHKAYPKWEHQWEHQHSRSRHRVGRLIWKAQGQDKCSLIIKIQSPEESEKTLEEGLISGLELYGCCVYNEKLQVEAMLRMLETRPIVGCMPFKRKRSV